MSDCVMTVNGFTVVLNTPQALPSKFGPHGEEIHCLPPYAPRPCYAVDDYAAAPESWMRGGQNATSWFVPVEAGHGMWLDFTRNHHLDHDVAIVVSIQGVNAITGLPAEDSALAQYRERCPVHDVPFEADRFCPQCGYKWPAQNYLASTTGRTLWIDGFRATGANGAPTGETRQFYFTEDVKLGVAAQILGDKRVFAIGVAFFRSKQPKPRPAYHYPYEQIPTESVIPMPDGYAEVINYLSGHSHDSGTPKYLVGQSSFSASNSSRDSVYNCSVAAAGQMSQISANAVGRGSVMPVKSLEIGAGAKIHQDLGLDPNPIDYWESTPAGLIYVNYTDVATAEAILNAGKLDRTAGGEGWLAPLHVGQPCVTAKPS